MLGQRGWLVGSLVGCFAGFFRVGLLVGNWKRFCFFRLGRVLVDIALFPLASKLPTCSSFVSSPLGCSHLISAAGPPSNTLCPRQRTAAPLASIDQDPSETGWLNPPITDPPLLRCFKNNRFCRVFCTFSVATAGRLEKVPLIFWNEPLVQLVHGKTTAKLRFETTPNPLQITFWVGFWNLPVSPKNDQNQMVRLHYIY